MTAALQTDNRAKKQELLVNAQRLLARAKAREHMADFMRLMMPDEEFPDDPLGTAYQDTAHGLLFCELVEKLEAGIRKRVAVSVPPQHGKTIHLSTFGPAWIWGRNPKARIVVATYNEVRADELGEAFRKVITSDRYRAVFPGVDLTLGSRSKSEMTNTKGGKIYFVGTGGTVTGRGADYFLIDDPMKDDEELQSDTAREKMWKWFFSVAYSRGNKKTRIAVVHTRWLVDDLIGRLCDKTHPERNGRFDGIAEDWLYLNISGVIEDPDLAKALGLELKEPTDPKVIRAFGKKPMAALWEADKDLAHFAQWKIGDPRTFSALVMGQPAIEDGEYFKVEHLLEYDRRDLPENLKLYGASDHAVSERQYRDLTCMGCVGIDEDDDIWVLPDLTWERMETDRTVEELLYHFKTHKPQLWWMENELISKSFGPFLHKRMTEERTYIAIDPITPAKDMRTRARAIQGRIANQKVHFPRFAPWWSRAKSEMLQFPYGPHDDFVSFLSLVGQGMMKERRPYRTKEQPSLVVVGSPQWIMRNSKERGLRDKRRAANAGW